MVSIRQKEHSRWRLLKLTLIAVWAANNLIHRPLNTQTEHLFIRNLKKYIYIYRTAPESSAFSPAAGSPALVRMFTLVTVAWKSRYPRRIALFVKMRAKNLAGVTVAWECHRRWFQGVSERVCGWSDGRSGKPHTAKVAANYFIPSSLCLPEK